MADRSSALSPRWTPRGDFPPSPAWVPDGDRERLSAYSKELKMWVDVHVNKNLKLAMRDVDVEIASVRQESRSALDLARRQEERVTRFEDLLTSVEDNMRREIEKRERGVVHQQREAMGALQLQTTFSIEGLTQTINELKQTLSHQEHAAKERERAICQAEILEMRMLHGENCKIHDEHKKLHKEYQAACGELRNLQKSQEKELKVLMDGQRDLYEMASGRGIRAWADGQESKLLGVRNDMSELAKHVKLQLADLQQESRGLIEGRLAVCSEAQQESRRLTEGRLTDLSRTLSHVAKQADIERIELRFEEALRQLGNELHSHRRDILSDLRSETVAMVKKEFAAASSLDEQLWQCDKRLGQRIDSLQQSLDDITHSCNEMRRKHEEGMVQQKLLSDLRSETAAMVKNEFAAVRALDEQLWLCDQRSGQRIDSLQQSVDEISRSCDEVMREHQESMRAMKLLVQRNARQTRSRSPEGTRDIAPDSCHKHPEMDADRRVEVTLKSAMASTRRAQTVLEEVERKPLPDSCRKRVEMDASARRHEALKSALASPRPAQALIEEIESEVHRDTRSRFVGRGLRRSDYPGD